MKKRAKEITCHAGFSCSFVRRLTVCYLNYILSFLFPSSCFLNIFRYPEEYRQGNILFSQSYRNRGVNQRVSYYRIIIRLLDLECTSYSFALYRDECMAKRSSRRSEVCTYSRNIEFEHRKRRFTSYWHIATSALCESEMSYNNQRTEVSTRLLFLTRCMYHAIRTILRQVTNAFDSKNKQLAAK